MRYCRLARASASIALLLNASFIGLVRPRPARADTALQANQLLGYFSAGCGTQGQWTSTALRYTNDLVETVKSVANDRDCQSISGALLQIQTLSTVLANYAEDANARELKGLQAAEHTLMVQVGQTTDSAQVAVLLSNLQATEVRIAQIGSYSSSDGSYRTTEANGRALQSLVSGTNLLLKQASLNQTCLLNNPGILTGVAGVAGSVSAMILTGGTSLAVAAGADILNGVIESARLAKLNKKIAKLSGSLTASAYQCVLESMSKQWCAGQDALRLLKIAGDASAHPGEGSEFQKGVNVLNVDSKVFTDWLDKLRAGSPPGNQPIANQMGQTRERQKQVLVARTDGLGIIAQQLPIFKAAVDEDRWTVEKQVIKQIVTAFIGGPCYTGACPTTVLADIFGSSAAAIAPWYLIGAETKNIPTNRNNNEPIDLSTYSLASLQAQIPGFTLDLNSENGPHSILRNMNAWIDLADKRVNGEVSRNVNLDPKLLVMYAATPDSTGNSPYRALTNIIHFVADHPSDDAAIGSFDDLYRDTLQILRTIACNVQAVSTRVYSPRRLPKEGYCDQHPGESDPVKAIEAISRVALLENGTGFIGDRLLWALRLSLNEMIAKGTGGADAQDAALILAQGDALSALEFYSGTTNHTDIQTDVLKGQAAIQAALGNFTDLVGPGIARAIDYYVDMSAQMHEKSQGPNDHQVNEFCLELLASPFWPKAVDPNVCIGRFLISNESGGPTSAIVTADLIGADYEDRACKYRDFFDASSLYQNFHGRPPRDR